MPKTAYLAKYLSSVELKDKYLKSQDTVEARRWHLLWKISLGWTIKNSAVAVGYSYSYAQKILTHYNLHGEEGVVNRKNQTSNHVRGKKRLLSQLQLEKLTRAIEKKPADGGIWTGTKVARWIEKETGRKKVWNQRGWDYLKKCGYSWQSPRPAHKKADLLEQEIFKANLPLKYEWLYVYGFVKPKTGETLWYLIPRVNTNWLNLVYQQFAIDAGVSHQKKFSW